MLFNKSIYTMAPEKTFIGKSCLFMTWHQNSVSAPDKTIKEMIFFGHLLLTLVLLNKLRCRAHF